MSVAVALGTLLFGAVPIESTRAQDAAWRMGGHDLSNSRHGVDERRIGPANVHRLTPRWVVDTDGDLSATPAVVDKVLYVPDWAGKLYKLDATTGEELWKVDLPAVSRGTPAVVGTMLVVPLLALPQGASCNGIVPAGACVIALDTRTGATLWQSRIDDHPLAYVTQSPVVADGRIYVGVTSGEEALAGFVDQYPCCTFRGSMNALDLATGSLIWKTYTVPGGAGLPLQARYAGASVWGSTPVIDRRRGAVYVTTGNNYNVPEAVKQCFISIGAPECETASDNLPDAVIALDLATGAIRWAKSFTGSLGYNWPPALKGYDAWNVACIADLLGGFSANCPAPVGPDYDFAQGPMLLRTIIQGRSRELLVAGQKSGVVWALDPDNGAIVWATITGPGGVAGGLQWGSATDGSRIYFANANSGMVPVTIGGTTTQSGFWGAIDTSTGAIVWRTADPTPLSGPSGPVTVANGVVYGASIGGPSPYTTLPGNHRTAPTMFALDAASGEIRWTHVAGGSVLGGAAVVGGRVFWGSGYANFGVGVDNRKLFAFELARP